MDTETKGYVSRRTDNGRKVYFGNGLIGVQPTPGSTITISINVTEGADGNVIAGSIINGDKLYYVNTEGITQIVNYSVVNTSPATGGSDEESLEDIRKNAIDNLTSLNRFVSENDFSNANVIMESSPFSDNTISILKRSDINNNEIQLYSPIIYSNEYYDSNIVPTRCAQYNIGMSTEYLPRKSEITVDGYVYYTLFDIVLDRLNESAEYNYIMYEINNTPTLISTYSSDFDILVTNLVVSKEGNKAIFKLYYDSTESNYDECTCELETTTQEIKYDMINDSTNSYFYIEFDPYTQVPLNDELYYFRLSDPSSSLISQYSSNFVFRKSLHDFMMSNAITDSTSSIIYDIPVILKSYYDTIDQRDFETEIMQTMMSDISLSDYRMLTDFINIKFSNTHGYLKNILLNPVTKSPVIDIVESLPSVYSDGDRYICREQEEDYKNYIYECSDATANIWIKTEPKNNDIVYVNEKDSKYILSSSGWAVLGRYKTPLEIDIDIFKESSYTGSITELSNTIKDTLLNEYSENFGNNIDLFRADLTDMIQSIDGINNCRIVKPETDIFFSYEIDDLTQDQLIEYNADYVFFTEDNIRIKVY